ncbi:matrixin family metalloprotease [Hymenobacter tibetensis]|uniref:Matrixin family metalloprotease n=1 Tax=Hymenobacter tibetensis TaxID=497967 RepID=A0ABY4CZ62_9BACT|nr:matrixin family metalloprotease [Hymenobacter tibetensis]UOG75302.1 matrixin family metalloprotease [Hymenobacter tibetensis]
MLVRLLVYSCVWLLLKSTAQAQSPAAAPETHCLLLALDPAQRAAQATLVVEGEVTTSRSFWDTEHHRIYTAHQFRVFSSLKGTAPAELTVLTEGGTVDLTRQELTNTLVLQPGQQGVLFLTRAAFPGTESAGAAWTAYGSQQGFIGYDLEEGTATEPFREYGLVTNAFYKTLTATTGQARQVVQPNPVLAAAVAQQLNPPALSRVQAPIISGLSPTTLPAGTGAVLTITGSGFGATRGSGFVQFRNADNGGGSFVKPRATDYVSWTDTRIQVRVPSVSETSGGARSPAGSGTVRVTSADRLFATSAMSILVPYGISNVLPANDSSQVVRPSLNNQNNRGGYGLRFEASFASNAPAATAFRRALTTWRCQSGVNWDIEPTPRTARGTEQDGENSIGFDQGTELPVNVLGRTTSYYQGCFQPNGTISFAVQEIDMQFDAEINWQFGPSAAILSQFDFETVAVHELGHAQQLAHVILPRAVMHYAVARGQTSRAISPDDITGARLVLRSRSFVLPACGPRPMLPAPLTTLSATTGTTGVGLTWTTQDECFLQEFVVERSVGFDTTAWQTLATVPRAGNAYVYLDAQPQNGLRYYRLRLRRPNGTFDTAAPLAVYGDAATAGEPQVFPNPVGTSGFRLQYPATTSGRLSVVIVDAIGRQHGLYALDYQPGLNLLPVPSATLRPGWYVLRLRSSEGELRNVPFLRLQ